MTEGPSTTARAGEPAYGAALRWEPDFPRLTPVAVVVSWVTAAASLLVAAYLVPGVRIPSAVGALVTAALVAVLNAVLPPVVAALRLPFTLALDFILILFLDAFMIKAAAAIDDRAIQLSSYGQAFAVALLASAAGVVIGVLTGTNDDVHLLRTIRRVSRRQGHVEETDVPGIVYLEIDGLAYPVLKRAMRDGHAPHLARWLGDGTHTLLEWETDFSSQTGASQAGILLGSNDDIPAFRWVEKETGKVMTCSAPADCAEIERRRATGRGLLVDGGGSRGNLLSGEADEVILTVSRMDAEKQANPGYRAFFANGSNVTRVLVLFFWEIFLEVSASLRAIRRDVRPRGHRGGKYPFLRAGICVVVRDLIVFGVLSDMMRGRPAIYATFSSYDEVAHHSGLERATRSRRCASSTRSSGGSTGPAATHHGPTRSWCSPTTARPRARRSCSATATASPTWSTGRSSAAPSPRSTPATSTTRRCRRRCARQPGGRRPPATRRRAPTSASPAWSCSARATWGSST